VLALGRGELEKLRRRGKRAITVEAEVPQPDRTTRTARRDLTLLAPAR
jgi:hypothetical protein